MTENSIKVQEILNEIQKSSTAQKGGIRKLQGLLEDPSSESSLEVMFSLFKAYDQLLVCTKKDPVVDRILKFFSGFIATSGDEIFRSGMEYLLLRSQALDKTVRQRSLQTIAAIMSSMLEGAEIADDLWETMSKGHTLIFTNLSINPLLTPVY